MSSCIILYDIDPDEAVPINCPGCGKFMKWDHEKGLYTCTCNRYLYHKTMGDPDHDRERIELGLPLNDAICRKPEGWKDEWGMWVIPEKISQVTHETRSQEET